MAAMVWATASPSIAQVFCRPVVGHFCQFLHNSILNLTNDGGIEGQGEERLRRYRESVYHL